MPSDRKILFKKSTSLSSSFKNCFFLHLSITCFWSCINDVHVKPTWLLFADKFFMGLMRALHTNFHTTIHRKKYGPLENWCQPTDQRMLPSCSFQPFLLQVITLLKNWSTVPNKIGIFQIKTKRTPNQIDQWKQSIPMECHLSFCKGWFISNDNNYHVIYTLDTCWVHNPKFVGQRGLDPVFLQTDIFEK